MMLDLSKGDLVLTGTYKYNNFFVLKQKTKLIMNMDILFCFSKISIVAVMYVCMSVGGKNESVDSGSTSN